MTSANALVQNEKRCFSGLVSVDGRTYPLKSANINARAEGGIAATTLVQTYENPYAEGLEVLYTLPLPADGAITGYTIRLGNRMIRGEVRKREEAREDYRKAMLEGRTAALLEQERADTFSQKLGSLPPGETAIVEIEVLQPLAFLPATQSESACWEYRFPTVAGVRYEGDENRVPDAETLDVDRAGDGLPVRMEAKIMIADRPASSLRPYSPHQQLVIQEEGDGVPRSFLWAQRFSRPPKLFLPLPVDGFPVFLRSRHHSQANPNLENTVFQQPKVLKISTSARKGLDFCRGKQSPIGLLGLYIADFVVFIMPIRFFISSWPLWYSYCACDDHAYREREQSNAGF